MRSCSVSSFSCARSPSCSTIDASSGASSTAWFAGVPSVQQLREQLQILDELGDGRDLPFRLPDGAPEGKGVGRTGAESRELADALAKRRAQPADDDAQQIGLLGMRGGSGRLLGFGAHAPFECGFDDVADAPDKLQFFTRESPRFDRIHPEQRVGTGRCRHAGDESRAHVQVAEQLIAAGQPAGSAPPSRTISALF